MEVERHHNREVRSGSFADAAEHLAVGVPEFIAHGSTVQRDQQTLHRAQGDQSVQNRIGEAFKVFGGNRTAGHRQGRKTRDSFHAFGGAAGEKAAQFVMGARPAFTKLGAGRHGCSGEVFPASGNSEKSIGFVQESEDPDARFGHELIVHRAGNFLNMLEMRGR